MVVQILHTLLGFAAVANLLLGIIVINRQRNNRSAQLFLLLTSSIFIWTIGILLLLRTSQYIWDQTALIGGILAICFFGVFVNSLINFKKRESKLISFYFLFFAFIFVFSVFIPNTIIYPGTRVENQVFVTYDTYGPMQIPFMVYGFFSLVVFLVLLFKALKESSNTDKNKFIYIFVAGIIIALISMTTNLFLPTFGYSVFGGIGPISSLIFTIVVTNSIFKQKTFHIKILLSEIIVFIFLAYIGALVFLAEDFGDFGFKMVSFIITFILSVILLKSVNNEMRLKEQVEQTYQKQSNFLADIAHKLKTPLTIVKINNDMAKISIKSKEYREAEESVNKSIQAVNHLARMSTNLVTLGKIDFGLSKLNKQQINLSELVESSTNDFKVILVARKLITTIEPNIKIFGDSDRLNEMILNLLDNAVKFTDAERGKIEVSLKTVEDRQRLRSSYRNSSVEDRPKTNNQNAKRNERRDPNRQTIVLIIKDNGIGIDEAVLPNLFSRYYQVESRSGSAGIGLSIVKWIVEGHGGKIEIKSKKGEGTKLLIAFSR